MATATSTSPKKRGVGPFALSFIDAGGKEHTRRVPLDVAFLRLKSNGESKDFDLSKAPPSVQVPSTYFTGHRRLQSHLSANAKGVGKNGTTFFTLAQSVIGDILEGRLYSKSEGVGRKAKPFDPTAFVNATARWVLEQSKMGMLNKEGKAIKPMTNAQKQLLATKVSAMQGAKRSAWISAKCNNKAFRRVLAEETAALEKGGSKDDMREVLDFDIE